MKYLNHLFLLLFATVTLSAQTFSGGYGSEDDPYQIATEQDLHELAKEVNDNLNNFNGVYFKQTADIRLTAPFTPIGITPSQALNRPDEMCFQGHYDGGMHKIYNLNLYDITELDGGDATHMNVGLFGSLGSDGVLENIVIASGDIYAFSHVGAIVGALHPGTQVKHYKVGPDVRVTAWSNGGGIVGGSVGDNISIIQCANYASVNVHGTGVHKCAGGIISQTTNAKVEGCANFGDIWARDGFAGGIIGYFPLSTEEFIFSYPELNSCLNAGDVTSIGLGAGGLIGMVAYNLSLPGGLPKPHQQVSNSYSYGQTFVAYSRTYGPVIGAFLKNWPVTAYNTFYNMDRFGIPKEAGSTDADIAFKTGLPKSHEEMMSDEFLQVLNDGADHLFEKDIHKFNANMPVLKWINDSYDPEIDKPNQYRTDIKQRKFERKAGFFFRPNRRGSFLIYNNDMMQPSVQSKSFGCSTDRVWVDRILSTKGGDTYTFFLSSSNFRKPIDKDGKYVKPEDRKPQTADHWFITPEFEVREGITWFHWVAGSEDEDLLSAYEVYVAEASADTPEAFKDLEPIYKTDAEKPVVTKRETDSEGKPRDYYELNPYKVDLSAYVGKKVRVAFRDVSTNKFFLMIGRFAVDGKTLANAPVRFEANSTVTVEDQTIVVTTKEPQQIEIYSLEGNRLAAGMGELRYQAEPAVYLVRTMDASGFGEVRKVIVR